MEELTFEQFLKAIPGLVNEVGEIKRLLLQKGEACEVDQLLNIEEAGQLLNLSVATIYSKVQKSELPNCKRGGRLYFSKLDLIAWVKAGRRKTTSEIEVDANYYVAGRKRTHHGK